MQELIMQGMQQKYNISVSAMPWDSGEGISP